MAVTSDTEEESGGCLGHRSLRPLRAIVDSMKQRKDFQLVVRKLESEVVEALRTRAARRGHSMEAEHRDILRAALRPAAAKTSFKDWLLEMPDVGTDKDFARDRRRPRPVKL